MLTRSMTRKMAMETKNKITAPTIVSPRQMSISLYNGDCLEIMKGLPDKSIDCFMTDLPYGCLTNQGGPGPRQKTGCPWDIAINLEKFWEQVKRLAKNDNTVVLMFCTTRFGYDLIKSNPDWFRYDLVWNKNSGCNPLDVNRKPMRSHEMVYIFSKKGAYYRRVDLPAPELVREARGGTSLGRTIVTKKKISYANTGHRAVLSVINFKKNFKRADNSHPTEKSVEMYRFLLERYCPPGGTMLDPTAGSFNSCIAGMSLDLHTIGIEMDKTFFDKAVAKLGAV